MTYIKGHFTCLGCGRETAVDDFFEGEFPRWELAMQDRFFRELIDLRERNELRPSDYLFTCCAPATNGSGFLSSDGRRSSGFRAIGCSPQTARPA